MPQILIGSADSLVALAVMHILEQPFIYLFRYAQPGVAIFVSHIEEPSSRVNSEVVLSCF